MPDQRDKYVTSDTTSAGHFKKINQDVESPIKYFVQQNSIQHLSDLGIIQKFKIKKNNGEIYLHSDRVQNIISPADLSVKSFIVLSLKILEIEQTLTKYNCRLDDLHPWNFLLINKDFKLVDLGALEFEEIKRHWMNDDFWHQKKTFERLYVNYIFRQISNKKFYMYPAHRSYNEVGTLDMPLSIVLNPLLLALFMYYKLSTVTLSIFKKIVSPIFLRRIYFANTRFLLSKLMHLRYIKSLSCKRIPSYVTDKIEGEYDVVYSDFTVEAKNKLKFDFLLSDENQIAYEHNHENSILNFNFADPCPAAGPNLCWSRSIFERITGQSALFIIDLDKQVGDKSLIVSDILNSIFRFDFRDYKIFLLFKGHLNCELSKVGHVTIDADSLSSQIYNTSGNKINHSMTISYDETHNATLVVIHATQIK